MKVGGSDHEISGQCTDFRTISKNLDVTGHGVDASSFKTIDYHLLARLMAGHAILDAGMHISVDTLEYILKGPA